jgi:hypothetical protein
MGNGARVFLQRLRGYKLTIFLIKLSPGAADEGREGKGTNLKRLSERRNVR